MGKFNDLRKYILDTKEEIIQLQNSTDLYKNSKISEKRDQIKLAITNFAINGLKSLSDEEFINKVAEYYYDHQSPELLKITLKCAGLQTNSPTKDFYFDINKINTISKDEFKAILTQSYNDFSPDEKAQKIARYTHNFTFQTEEAKEPENHLFENALDFVNCFVDSSKFDDFVPDDEIYKDPFTFDESRLDIHVLSNEIESLRNDPDFINDEEAQHALDDADNFIITKNNVLNERLFTSIENRGKESERNLTTNIYEKFVNIYGNNFKLSGSSINTNGTDLNFAKSILRDIPSRFFVSNNPDNQNEESPFLNQEDKQKLINIYTFLKNNNLIGEANVEQGAKEYGFSSLVSSYNKIKTAVIKKDKKALLEGVNEYKKNDQIIQNALQIVEDAAVKENGFPGNVSVSRSEVLPAKYRVNYGGPSYFNNLIFLFNSLNALDIKLEDFLNDPKILLQTYINKSVESGLVDKHVQQLNKKEFITQVLSFDSKSNQGDIHKIYNQVHATNTLNGFSVMGLARAMSNIRYFTKNKKVIDEIDLFNSAMSVSLQDGSLSVPLADNIKKTFSFEDCESNEEKIDKLANFLAVNPKDFHFHQFAPNCENIKYELYDGTFTKFNRVNYLKANSNPYKELISGLKTYSNLVEDKKLKLTDETKTTFENALIKNIEVFPQENLSKTFLKYKEALINHDLKNIDPDDLIVLDLDSKFDEVLSSNSSFKDKSKHIGKVISLTNGNDEFSIKDPDFINLDVYKHIRETSSPMEQLFRGMNLYNYYIEARDFSKYSKKEIDDQKIAFKLAIISNVNAFPVEQQSKLMDKYKTQLASGGSTYIDTKDYAKLEKEDIFFKLTKQPFTKEKQIEALKMYADVKKEYEGRSWFAKIFFKDAKNTKLLMEDMNQRLLDSGFNQPFINKCVNNIRNGLNDQLSTDIDEANIDNEVQNNSRFSIVMDRDGEIQNYENKDENNNQDVNENNINNVDENFINHD